MTKLEEEIRQAITKVPSHYDRIAVAAAEVAKKYIEKAYNAEAVEYMNESALVSHNIMKARWLKENGITE